MVVLTLHHCTLCAPLYTVCTNAPDGQLHQDCQELHCGAYQPHVVMCNSRASFRGVEKEGALLLSSIHRVHPLTFLSNIVRLDYELQYRSSGDQLEIALVLNEVTASLDVGFFSRNVSFEPMPLVADGVYKNILRIMGWSTATDTDAKECGIIQPPSRVVFDRSLIPSSTPTVTRAIPFEVSILSIAEQYHAQYVKIPADELHHQLVYLFLLAVQCSSAVQYTTNVNDALH